MIVGTAIGIFALLAFAAFLAMCAEAKRAAEADLINRRLANPPTAKVSARIHSIAIERMRRKCS